MDNGSGIYQVTAARIRLVARHYSGQVLDVGIGAGQFVTARPDTKGLDVNPAGVECMTWGQNRGIKKADYVR